jgi:hypothetical protein
VTNQMVANVDQMATMSHLGGIEVERRRSAM